MKINFTAGRSLGEAIVYAFESETREGLFHYTMKLRHGGVVCTCEGWGFRGWCKHVTAIPLDSDEAQSIQKQWRDDDRRKEEVQNGTDKT